MDDEPLSPWEVLLEIIARYGMCASCHFAPDLEGSAFGDAWTCPRCGFLSTADPENWGPVSRNTDPVGADEPCYGLECAVEDDLDDEEMFEPDFPIFASRR